jgi:hypothetical protein
MLSRSNVLDVKRQNTTDGFRQMAVLARRIGSIAHGAPHRIVNHEPCCLRT